MRPYVSNLNLMNVLAIQSSGNETSLCVILGDDVLEYSISHQRKDRPNWQEMLSKIGLDSFFFIDDIDIFDESFSWILSIDHDGSMFLWNG